MSPASESPAAAPHAETIELFLYVSEASRASLRAIRRLEALVRSYEAGRVRLRIVDLAREHPPEFDEDRIAFTPTLVKRSPGPKIFFLGALERLEDIAELLGEPAGEPQGRLHDSQATDRRSRA